MFADDSDKCDSVFAGFVLLDKEKRCVKKLHIKFSACNQFIDAVNEFERRIEQLKPCVDLDLSLHPDEYYLIQPGEVYERLLKENDFDVHSVDLGNIDELSQHLSSQSRTAALVVEQRDSKKRYLFAVSKAIFKKKFAFCLKGEKLIEQTSDIFFFSKEVSLSISNQEIAYVDSTAASRFLPIAEMNREKNKTACEKLSVEHNKFISCLAYEKASCRKLSIGKQILNLVEEMGDEKFIESARAASKKLKGEVRERLFDSENRIVIDFKDEEVLNFLAENTFQGAISDTPYVATTKRKKQ